ncbi:MAG: hypothetical protein ACLR0U_17945 [Enterocloster clostridioformis]
MGIPQICGRQGHCRRHHSKGMPTFRASVWEDEQATAAMPEDYIRLTMKEIQADTTNRYGLPRMTAVSEAEGRHRRGPLCYSIETKGEGTDPGKQNEMRRER